MGEWSGVTTDDNGRVIWLQIGGSGSGQELNGEIPLELIGLGALEILGLSGGFHGVGLRGEIPPELGNLASLQHLRLRGEGLSGGIPPELGNLKQLYGLYIYSTQLGGAIPPELGNISLTELHLFDNEFSGEIPPWLGNHSYLIGLSLGGNQLSGEIPAEWVNFNRLESLDLSRNQLSGEIPSELGNLDNLKSLTLHENQLSGAIPSELWNLLEREVEIEIHGNQFPCLTGGLRHPTGYSLNAMEVRNSRFDGQLKQTAEIVAADEFFSSHDFFTVNDIRRMEDTKFVLAYMITVMSTYFNLEREVEAFLERYNEKFREAAEIQANSKKVFNFVEHCKFEPSARIWQNRADMFTLLVESHRAIVSHGQELDHQKLGAKLKEFYALVDKSEIDSGSRPVKWCKSASSC